MEKRAQCQGKVIVSLKLAWVCACLRGTCTRLFAKLVYQSRILLDIQSKENRCVCLAGLFVVAHSRSLIRTYKSA